MTMNRDLVREIILEEVYDLLEDDLDYDVNFLPFSLSLMEIYGDLTADQRKAEIEKRAAALKKKWKKTDAVVRAAAEKQVDREIEARKSSATTDMNKAKEDAEAASDAWREAMEQQFADTASQPAESPAPAPGTGDETNDVAAGPTQPPADATQLQPPSPPESADSDGKDNDDGADRRTVTDTDDPDTDDLTGGGDDNVDDSTAEDEPEQPGTPPSETATPVSGQTKTTEEMKQAIQASIKNFGAATPQKANTTPANESFHKRKLADLLYGSW